MFCPKLQQKIACILILSFSSLSFAHSGRTDSSGCHNDNIHGGYHCHNDGSGGSSSSSKGGGAVVVGVLVAVLVYYYRDHIKGWFHRSESKNQDHSGLKAQSNYTSVGSPVAGASGFVDSGLINELGPDRDTLLNEYRNFISVTYGSSVPLEQPINLEKDSCEKLSSGYQCLVRVNGLKKMVILSDQSGNLAITGTRSFE
jgi:hypothetical protein